jgi:hypothetical protein
MPTLDQIGEALRRADAAGNTDDARQLAQAYAQMRDAQGGQPKSLPTVTVRAPNQAEVLAPADRAAAITDSLGGSPLGLVAALGNYARTAVDANTAQDSRLRGVVDTVADNVIGAPVAAMHHAQNIPVGLAQLATHGAAAVGDAVAGPQQNLSGLITGEAPQRTGIAGALDRARGSVDDFARQREQTYQSGIPTNVGSVAGAAVGEIVPWVAGLGAVRAAGIVPKATTTAQKLGQLALEGGAVGAAQPVTGDGSFAAQKALQVGTGALSGPVLHGIGRGVAGVRAGAQDVLQHIRDPQVIADREILRRFGADPDALAKLRAAQPSVPGETVSAAQANPTPATIAQERILRSNPETKEGFSLLDDRNNAARMATIKRLAGTDEQLEAAKTARREAVQPFIDAHLTPATPLIRWDGAGQQIDSLLNKPGRMSSGDFDALQQARKVVAQVKGGTLQEDDAFPMLRELEETTVSGKARKAFADAFDAINRNMVDPAPLLRQIAMVRNTGQGARATIRPALDAIAKTLQESQNTRGLVPADVLDSVRQNIKDFIVKPNGASASAQEIAALAPVKNHLQALIERHAPGYSAYLAKYAKGSEPINTMESVRALLDPNSPHSINTSGDPQLAIARLRQVLRGDDKARYPMSDAARRELEIIRAGLERRMAANNTVSASGSNTNADMLAARGSAIGRGIFGDPLAGKPGTLSRAVGIGLGGTLGNLVPIPGAGIGGALLGGLLPEASQAVNARIAQRIGATAADSRAAADAIERALRASRRSGNTPVNRLLLLGDTPPRLPQPARRP